AVGARPLRRVAARVVVHLLHEALLVLWREQRQVGGNLQDRAVVPGGALVTLAQVTTAPVGQVGLRVARRPALCAGFGEQRRVVVLRRSKAVGADDLLTRIVALAIAPCCRAWRIVPDQGNFVGTPDLLQPDGRIAAVVARVEPQLAVLVEVG